MTRREACETTVRADGTRRHKLADGRFIDEDGPGFLLMYESPYSTNTFTREISIIGLDDRRPYLFEAWCYKNDDLRTFAFTRVISLTELRTGTTVSGVQLLELMGGTSPPTGPEGTY